MIIENATLFLQKSELSSIINRIGPYKLKRRYHHFSVLVESIISQQITTYAAEAIFQRFKKIYPIFPTASQILSTNKSQLRAAGLSNMKIEYLRDLAAHIKDGRLDLKSLSKMRDENVITQLTQVKGIGKWTAEMFLIFSLGRQDIFPANDLGLRKAIQLLFSMSEIPKPKDVSILGERWKPYRTIATWYLWKSLQKFNKIG